MLPLFSAVFLSFLSATSIPPAPPPPQASRGPTNQLLTEIQVDIARRTLAKNLSQTFFCLSVLKDLGGLIVGRQSGSDDGTATELLLYNFSCLSFCVGFIALLWFHYQGCLIRLTDKIFAEHIYVNHHNALGQTSAAEAFRNIGRYLPETMSALNIYTYTSTNKKFPQD